MLDRGQQAQLEGIPRPPAKPLVDNLLDIDTGAPVATLNDLAGEYGPIFKLQRDPSVCGEDADTFDPDHETPTQKPDGFTIKVRPRTHGEKSR